MVAQDKDERYQVAYSYIEPPTAKCFEMSNMYHLWQAHTAIVTVSEGTYKAIQKQIGEFREEILGMAKDDRGADRVASFSIQLLPRGENEQKRKRG